MHDTDTCDIFVDFATLFLWIHNFLHFIHLEKAEFKGRKLESPGVPETTKIRGVIFMDFF